MQVIELSRQQEITRQGELQTQEAEYKLNAQRYAKVLHL